MMNAWFKIAEWFLVLGSIPLAILIILLLHLGNYCSGFFCILLLLGGNGIAIKRLEMEVKDEHKI
jgi:hypothetical protein